MKNNLVARKSTLDQMIDILGIIDEETGMPPVLGEERGFAKLQMLCAQILARDAIEIDKRNPKCNLQNALDVVCANLSENIKTIAIEILKNQKMQIDVTKKLRKIQKMRI